MSKTRSIRISEETYARIEQFARLERRSVSNMAETLILGAFAVWEASAAGSDGSKAADKS